jgi:hypothetical protein
MNEKTKSQQARENASSQVVARRRREPALSVRDAAALLLFSGYIQMLGSVPLVAVGMGTMNTPIAQDKPFRWLLLPLGVASMMLGAFVVAGSLQMRQLRHYGFCRVMIILAMLPLGAGFLVGLPSGVWGLFVLKRAAVKAAFALNDNHPS